MNAEWVMRHAAGIIIVLLVLVAVIIGLSGTITGLPSLF